jgi:AraC family transcriptional regulator
MAQITQGEVIRQISAGDFRVTETLHPALFSLSIHDHENPNINLVLKGGLQERVENRSFDCGEGSALVKPGGAKHSNDYGRAATRCVIVESMQHGSCHDGFGRLEILFAQSRAIGSLSRQIVRELHCSDSAAELALEGLALQLKGVLSRHQTRNETHRHPRWLTQAREMLDSHTTRHLSLQDIAFAVGVDRSHFSRQFKRYFHVSPAEYVRHSRVCAAADLIRAGGNLLDIALQCGFYDQSHFAKKFHQVMGVSPGEYKRIFAHERTKNT